MIFVYMQDYINGLLGNEKIRRFMSKQRPTNPRLKEKRDPVSLQIME